MGGGGNLNFTLPEIKQALLIAAIKNWSPYISCFQLTDNYL